MNPEIEQLKERIRQLEQNIAQFMNVSQLDPQIVRTITATLSQASSKGASSENQAVNEAGGASYSVLGIPDGFIRIGDVNVPYYN